MTKKPRERSPATACNVISLGSLRGWRLMRRDTRWRKLEAPPPPSLSNKGETDYRFVK